MLQIITVTVSQADGWHARPATEFARVVGESGLLVTIGRQGEPAVRGDSVLSLLTLGARFGEELIVTATSETEGDPNIATTLIQLAALFA